MITAAEVAAKYTIGACGRIVSKGEFYGEHRYIPHFWKKANQAKHICVEELDGNRWLMCAVTKEEIAEYPELAGISRVGVCRIRGAVCSWVHSWAYQRKR